MTRCRRCDSPRTVWNRQLFGRVGRRHLSQISFGLTSLLGPYAAGTASALAGEESDCGRRTEVVVVVAPRLHLETATCSSTLPAITRGDRARHLKRLSKRRVLRHRAYPALMSRSGKVSQGSQVILGCDDSAPLAIFLPISSEKRNPS
jgi:hypothetical protein